VWGCCFILGHGTAQAEKAILVTLVSTRQTVVSVQATTGVVFGDKPKAFIHKESGQLMVHQKMSPVIHTRDGTGIIIDPSGIIITNLHTIFKAGMIKATLYEGKQYSATVLGVIPEHDLGLIKIDIGRPLPFSLLTDSNRIKLGDRVYSIGGSKILKNTISEGKISGIGKSKRQLSSGKQYVDLIQVNFDLYHGDSGSPLLDHDGKLLGIMAAAAINKSKVTYAIPSNKIAQAMTQFVKKLPESVAA